MTNTSLTSEFETASIDDQLYNSDLFIGRAIKRRRKMLGMTQSQLGERVGCRFQQIQKYECGANKVSAARLGVIATALQVDMNFFYPENTQPRTDQAVPEVFSRLAAAWHTVDPKTQQQFLRAMRMVSDHAAKPEEIIPA